MPSTTVAVATSASLTIAVTTVPSSGMAPSIMPDTNTWGGTRWAETAEGIISTKAITARTSISFDLVISPPLLSV